MKISSSVCYITDNGCVLCGEHLGTSAKYSGRDISGQPIVPITPEVMKEADALGYEPKCEQCGKRPSRLYVEV